MASAHTASRTRSPTIAVFGEWSESNLGDHAIHEGVRSYFEARGWRTRSYDFGALRPARTESSASGVPTPRSLGSLLSPRAKRSLRIWRQQILIRRLLPGLGSVDAICVGGGALLTDINLHFPQSLAAVRWAAERLAKPLLCLGCSVEGPWSWAGERMVRHFARYCDFIATRDLASADQMGELLGTPVPVFGDFALPLRATVPMQREGARHALALNVNHVPAPHSSQQPHYEDALVALASRFVAGNGCERRIAVFTTGTEEDRAPARRVHARLAALGADLYLCSTLAELRGVVRASALVAAARLHAAIIALAEQVPVIGFAPTPKVGDFFATVGLSDCGFDLLDAIEEVVAAAHEIRRNPPQPELGPGSPIQQTRSMVDGLLWQLAHGHRPDRQVSA